MDRVIRWINLYPVYNAIGLIILVSSRNLLLPNYTFPLDGDLSLAKRYLICQQLGPFFTVYFVYPRSNWELLRTRWTMSVRSRSNWDFKMLVLKERGEPKYPEKNLLVPGRKPKQTRPAYSADARIRTRATLMGGEREIRFLKEEDEGG